MAILRSRGLVTNIGGFNRSFSAHSVVFLLRDFRAFDVIQQNQSLPADPRVYIEMKLPQIAILITIYSTFVNAVQLDLSTISNCSLSCLAQTFSEANCSLFDTSCQCDNQALVYSTSTCLLQECPLADSVALGQLRDKICGRVPESRHQTMLIVNISMGTLSTLVVALRLLSRRFISKKIWLDDYFIISAVAVNMPSIATAAWMQVNGLGKHIWYLPIPRIPKILKFFYVSETLYLLILTLTKISILMFYIRIFPKRRFRMATYTILGFVVLAGLVILFLQIFQCLPIAYNWDRSIKEGKCLNINILTYTHAGMSILQDFAILLLPIPELVLLKMEKRQKVGLILIFQIGLFACITSIIRLRSLTQFDGTKTIDPTWDNVKPTIWTAAEINTAIICCSLPALRPLLRAWFPKPLDPAHKRRVAFEQLKELPSGKSDDVSTAVNTQQGMESATSEIGLDLKTYLDKPLPLAPARSAYVEEIYRNRSTWEPRVITTEFVTDSANAISMISPKGERRIVI